MNRFQLDQLATQVEYLQQQLIQVSANVDALASQATQAGDPGGGAELAGPPGAFPVGNGAGFDWRGLRGQDLNCPGVLGGFTYFEADNIAAGEDPLIIAQLITDVVNVNFILFDLYAAQLMTASVNIHLNTSVPLSPDPASTFTFSLSSDGILTAYQSHGPATYRVTLFALWM